ncbi:hypothetical protein TNCV_3982761 [Trichonephila clavipes]|nr:hypothetical protein TNCV_3982761 [Trichonephila clavipes]
MGMFDHYLAEYLWPHSHDSLNNEAFKAFVKIRCHAVASTRKRSAMQEETTGREGRSRPPRCPTACDDRRNVRMAVMDRAATSKTIAQQIQTVTHHSMLAHTI